MRKKLAAFYVGYYVLCLPIYAVSFLVSELMLVFIVGFGSELYIYRYLLLIATAIVAVIVTRFSLMKWYVDPIAAVEVPFAIYFCSMLSPMLSWDMSFYDSFLWNNERLSSDGGKGWIFFLELFVVGLIASFSLNRRKGKSISYRVISKFTM